MPKISFLRTQQGIARSGFQARVSKLSYVLILDEKQKKCSTYLRKQIHFHCNQVCTYIRMILLCRCKQHLHHKDLTYIRLSLKSTQNKFVATFVLHILKTRSANENTAGFDKTPCFEKKIPILKSKTVSIQLLR